MKKNSISSKLLYFAFILFSFYNCNNDDEVIGPVTLDNEIHDFVWKGLNEIYLWKEDVPNLADNNFSSEEDYFRLLNGFDSPESTFDNLLYRKDEVDKFSFIVDDYVELENSFQGISLSSGVDFSIGRISSGSNTLFGYVKYIATGSNAADKDIKRGDFFLTVNGQELNIDNYQDLLFDNNNQFSLGMANITENSLELNGKIVDLTKTEFTENPILINKTLDVQGIKVGYLMYNSFIANFDVALNNAFRDLKSEGISELVLDLRYNPGGRVSSAIALASMITGQFTGEVFSQEIWNPDYQSFFEQNNPERLLNRFVDKIGNEENNIALTHLNLNRVFILTTSGSASASELVINGLEPYIDVVQIGTATTGKYTASITLYDAENFSREDANPNHKYALQPLVLKSANVDGVSDYFNGLTPDYQITYQTTSGDTNLGENIRNLGILGDKEEPFLAKALALISGNTSKFYNKNNSFISPDIEIIALKNDFSPLRNGMFTDLKDLN